jgi:hypothetical protein
MTTTTARECLRVSVDKSGRERSPEEQHGDNQRVAAEHGWQLGEPYRDVGSASRYANGRRRPDSSSSSPTWSAAGSAPACSCAGKRAEDHAACQSGPDS